jgi:hypothetical protein
MKKEKIITVEQLLKNSDKAEYWETMRDVLRTSDKIVTIAVRNTPELYYTQVITMGIDMDYEILGIMDVTKRDLLEE